MFVLAFDLLAVGIKVGLSHDQIQRYVSQVMFEPNTARQSIDIWSDNLWSGEGACLWSFRGDWL